MSTIRYIGLDFETSGTSHTEHAPIQIGLATAQGAVFDALIGGWTWKDAPAKDQGVGVRRYSWSGEAEGIHGIKREWLDKMDTPKELDPKIAEWIERFFYQIPAKKIVAVGWNVAGFDVPFLREYFPITTERMSYRTVDLNAVVFAMTEAGLTNRYGTPWTYYSLKDNVKSKAEKRASDMGFDPGWHSAYYDALTALFAFEELQKELRAGRIV